MLGSGRLRMLLLGAGGAALGAWLLRWFLRKLPSAVEDAQEVPPTPAEAPAAQPGSTGGEVAAEEAAAEPAPERASLGLGGEPSHIRDFDSGRPATAAGGSSRRSPGVAGLGSEGSSAAWHFAELPLDAPPAAVAEARPATAGGGAGQPAGRRQGTRKEGGIAKGFFNKSPKRKEPVSAAAPPAPEPRQPREEEQGEVGEARTEGLHLLRAGSHVEAQVAFRRMRALALAAGSGRAEGRALCLLARALEGAGAAEPEVEDAYKQALKIAHNRDDMELSFSVLTGMGSHAFQTGDADLAEHFYLQAQTLARRVLTEREEAMAEGNLGLCLSQGEARRPEALDHFRKATTLQERAGGSRSPQAVRALQTALEAFVLGEGLRKEAQGLLKRVAQLVEQAKEFDDWEIDL